MSCCCPTFDNQPSPHDLVGDVLAKWPGSAAVLLRYGMACPGCVMAPMMTLNEAAAAYGIEVGCLIAEIRVTTAFPPSP